MTDFQIDKNFGNKIPQNQLLFYGMFSLLINL